LILVVEIGASRHSASSSITAIAGQLTGVELPDPVVPAQWVPDLPDSSESVFRHSSY
jgi:hypothetical protein